MRKPKPVRIWLDRISCIDHGWCDSLSDNTIQGGSFMASFVVTGNIDPVEQVVVDFSTLKHDIKAIIDHPETGLDHKLWVFPNAWDSCTPYREGYLDRIGGIGRRERVRLVNKTVSLDVPADAVAFIHCPSLTHTYSVKTAEAIVQDLVQKNLEAKYPGIQVECKLSEKPDIPRVGDGLESSTRMFRYFHGLKHSTSKPCQNVAHGHLSFVTFFYSHNTDVSKVYEINQELDRMIRCIDKTAFFFTANRVESNISADYCAIEYTTPERGRFRAEYHLGHNRLIGLDVETTIENLLGKLADTYSDIPMLKRLGVTHIAMSEGLQKGSLISLADEEYNDPI